MKSRIYLLLAICMLAMTCWTGAAVGADYGWMKKDEQAAVTEKKAKNSYFLVRGGWFFSDEPSGMNTGTGAEVGLGMQPLRWLAAEGSIGFIDADDYDDNVINKHLTIQMVPVTGTVRAILPINQFDLYALAGGGIYYTMLTSDNLNQSYSGSDSNDKVLFGYHYGGGASVLLGGGSSVGAEVRQIVTKWDDMDISGTFVTGFFRLGF